AVTARWGCPPGDPAGATFFFCCDEKSVAGSRDGSAWAAEIPITPIAAPMNATVRNMGSPFDVCRQQRTANDNINASQKGPDPATRFCAQKAGGAAARRNLNFRHDERHPPPPVRNRARPLRRRLECARSARRAAPREDSSPDRAPV